MSSNLTASANSNEIFKKIHSAFDHLSRIHLLGRDGLIQASPYQLQPLAQDESFLIRIRHRPF